MSCAFPGAFKPLNRFRHESELSTEYYHPYSPHTISSAARVARRTKCKHKVRPAPRSGNSSNINNEISFTIIIIIRSNSDGRLPLAHPSRGYIIAHASGQLSRFLGAGFWGNFSHTYREFLFAKHTSAVSFFRRPARKSKHRHPAGWNSDTITSYTHPVAHTHTHTSIREMEKVEQTFFLPSLPLIQCPGIR